MPYQLVFTSAAELLEGSAPGYGIVACSEGIPCSLRGAAVSVSELKEPAGRGILGPQFSYRLFRIGGQTYHTLSTVQPGGADYSGRDCIIAHHLILSQGEVDRIQRHAAKLTPAGIMHALAAHGFWLSRWEEHPHYIHQDPPLSVADLPDAGGQPTWKKLTGSQRDIRAFNAQPYDKECLAVVPEGTTAADILLLLHESDSLSPTGGWGHTFCSYAAPEDSFAETQRLFTVSGSPIEQNLQRSGRPRMVISPASFLAAGGERSPDRNRSAATEYAYEQPADTDTYDLPRRRLPLIRALLLLGGVVWGSVCLVDPAAEHASAAAKKIQRAVNERRKPALPAGGEPALPATNDPPAHLSFSLSVVSPAQPVPDKGNQTAAAPPGSMGENAPPGEAPLFAAHLRTVREGDTFPRELCDALLQKPIIVRSGSVTIVPMATARPSAVIPLSREGCSLVWEQKEVGLYTATVRDSDENPLHTITLTLNKKGALQKVREGKSDVIASLPTPAQGKNYNLRTTIFSPSIIIPANGYKKGLPLPSAIAQAAIALSPAALELTGHQAARKLSLKRAFRETFPWAPYKEKQPARLSIRLPRIDGPNAIQLSGDEAPSAPPCEIEYACIDNHSDTIVISLARTFDISAAMLRHFNSEANGREDRFYSPATLYSLMVQMDSANNKGEFLKLCEQYALLFENQAFAAQLHTILDKIPVIKPDMATIPPADIRQAARSVAPLVARGLGNKKNRQRIKEAVCRHLNRVLYPVLEAHIRDLERDNGWFLRLSDITELTPEGGLLWKFTLHRAGAPEKTFRTRP